MQPMTRSMPLLAFGLVVVAAAAPSRAGAIKYGEPSISLLQEFGMLQSGRFSSAGPFRQEWVDHFGSFYSQEAQIGENLDISVGMGGIFQFQKPEEVSASWGGSQYRNFFIGPSRATLGYRAGDPGDPWLRLGFGMFPFKYNPDAANLGEYLFRSNPYPNYLMTGGYAVINNAAAYLQGGSAQMKFGNLDLQLLLVTETTLPPLYDWSLAALASWKTAEGLLEVGGGVNFKRVLPIRPSRTRPEQARNAYFRRGGTWYTGSLNEYRGRMDFATRSGRAEEAATWKAVLDSVTAWIAQDTAAGAPPAAYKQGEHGYFSSAGTVLMGRFSLDPKPLLPRGVFGKGRFGPQDLKLYGEAALLGLKDYPVFYEDKLQRLPAMLGLNLPAFGLLDLFAVQVERYRSPYLNSTERVATAGLPQPYMPRGTDTTLSRDAYYDAGERDDFSWSVLLKKEILPGVTLYSQFARDHLRLVSLNTWFGPALETDENLGSEKDWYWMVQVGIGI